MSPHYPMICTQSHKTVPSRSNEKIIGERHFVTWTEQEDEILRDQVRMHGPDKWGIIAIQLPNKTSRQCRRRWQMYLSSDCKKGGWSPEEDQLLIEARKKFGNRWTEIAKIMPGRTDNAVKNRFTSLCKKQAKEAEFSPSQSSSECYSDEVKHTHKRSRALESHNESITSSFSLTISKAFIKDGKQQSQQSDDVLPKENIMHEGWISLKPGGFISVDQQAAAVLPASEFSGKAKSLTRLSVVQEKPWSDLDWISARRAKQDFHEISFSSAPFLTNVRSAGTHDALDNLFLYPPERNVTVEQPKYQSQSTGGFAIVNSIKQLVSPASKSAFLKSASEYALSPLHLAQFLVDGMPSPQFSDNEKQFLLSTFSDFPGQHLFHCRSSPFRSPFRQLSFSENVDHSAPDAII